MEFLHFLSRMPQIVLCLSTTIIGLLLFFSLRYTNSLRPIERDLETVSKILKAFKGPITDSKLEVLKEQCGNVVLFRDPWEEFSETLVLVRCKDGSEVAYNTRRANEFINAESLIEHHLNVYWYQSLPTVLTGLGLVGTFMAILLGLNALQVDPVSGQVDHIGDFINSLSGKFTSSIVGLASAMVFLTIEKYHLGALNNKCIKIEQQLDRLFPQRVTEEILADMLKHLEEQSNNFRHFGSELSDHMKQSFQESIVPVMERLADAIDQMLQSAENLQKQKEESAASVIQEIAANFKSALNEHAGAEINKLAECLKETSNFADHMNSKVGALLTHSEQLLTSQQEQSVAHTEALNESVNKMLERVDDMGKTFTSLAANFEETNNAFISSIRASVSDMLLKNREWSENFHEKFSESLGQQGEFNDELQRKIGASIDASLSRLKSSFEEHLQTANQSIESVIQKLQDWAKSTSEELVGYAGVLSTQAGTLTEAGQSIKEASSGLEDSFRQQKSFLVEVAAVGSSLTNASQSLTSSTASLNSLHVMSDEGLQRIMAQVNKSDQVMKELQTLLDQQKAIYTTLDETVGKTLSAVNSAVRDYSEHTRESLGSHLTTFDKHLADAANQLHGTVSDLEEHLGELSDMLERTVAASAASGR
jgi:ElaB/YqjD/DUF883 family membrane-anchored ribosome-binding protein